jgi:hypothetical protein
VAEWLLPRGQGLLEGRLGGTWQRSQRTAERALGDFCGERGGRRGPGAHCPGAPGGAGSPATPVAKRNASASGRTAPRALGSYLVDSASSHMLVSKIKPCMSKYKQLYGETANGSLNQLSFI